MDEVRAITLKQPWGWAITHAGKRIENRPTLWKYRGILLIHVGAGWDTDGQRDQRVLEAFQAQRPGERCWPSSFTSSAIVARSRLVDVHHATARCYMGGCAPWGAMYPKATHLVLADLEVLPVPIRWRQGALGLWRPPPHLIAAVDRDLAGSLEEYADEVAARRAELQEPGS